MPPAQQRKPTPLAKHQATNRVGQHRIERKAAKSTNVAREAALAFAEADANGDGELDWDEVHPSFETHSSESAIALSPWRHPVMMCRGA